MNKIILALLMVMPLMATDYISIINAIAQDEVDKFRSEFSAYNALVVETSAAMIATSNVDFNPDHIGFSAGVGIATIHTGYGDGNAYAVGVQYAVDSVALNIKGSYGESGKYFIGSGLVVGF